ncbi:MAG: class I SAM-dependent methyltransferase [Bryobacteraceae bacterium]
MASASKPIADIKQADYGIDAPGVVRWLATRGALLAFFGVIVFYVNGQTNPQAARSIGSLTFFPGLGFLFGAALVFWSSRVGKLKLRDEILDRIQWKGDEKILDVGCGSGLMLIGAAKRLGKGGKATGVDIWSTKDQSGNGIPAITANAKVEGVLDKVRIDTGDARKLSYADASFDVVLSTLVIHNIRGSEGRELAISEIWRVLKPGGTIAIADIANIGTYTRLLKQHGAQLELSDRTFLLGIPSRWILARKP